MIILFVLVSVFVIGLILCFHCLEESGMFMVVIGAVLLSIAFIGLLANPSTIMIEYEGFEGAKLDYREAVKSGSCYFIGKTEGEVVKANVWLSKVKYYNDGPFEIWVPDIVEELNPIELIDGLK